MAILFTEGFDRYSNDSSHVQELLLDKWSSKGPSLLAITTNGRISGRALALQGQASNRYLAYNLPTGTNTELTIGFAFKNTPMSVTLEVPIIRLSAAGGSSQIGLGLVTQNNVVSVSDVFTSLGNNGFTMSLDEWYYFELKLVYGVTGSYEFRVNGVTIDSQTNIDTTVPTQSDFGVVEFFSAGFTFTYDDIYIAEDLGFLDPLHIETLTPDAVGTFSDGTPSTGGTNFPMVDDPFYKDDDSTYIELTGIGDKDTYGYQDKSTDGEIVAANVVSYVRDTGTAVANMKNVAISASTTSVDAGQQVNSGTYAVRSFIYDTDPDTGSAWTSTAFNAAQFGYELG